MTDTSKEAPYYKWGGCLSFGQGRKRLLIAFCALSVMIAGFVAVITLKAEDGSEPPFNNKTNITTKVCYNIQ